MVDEAGFGNARFRINVPREQPDHIILTLEPFLPQPPEVYTDGVRCVTVPDSARPNPRAKYDRWEHDRRPITEALGENIYTALLLDSAGNILEGLSSNFYAIRDGELHTADEGVLPGVAQQIVFAVAPGILPVRKQAVNMRNLPHLDEAFITSSSRGIVPVVEIDGQQIGQGKPGPLTQSLREAYLAWVEEHLEEL
jgi:branched-chain amino acid aminotransferase